MTLEYTYLNEAYSNVRLSEAGPSFIFPEDTRETQRNSKKKFNETVLETVIEVEEPPPLYTESLNNEQPLLNPETLLNPKRTWKQYFKQLFTFKLVSNSTKPKRTWKEFFMCGRSSVILV